jgi:hypothetical protein
VPLVAVIGFASVASAIAVYALTGSPVKRTTATTARSSCPSSVVKTNALVADVLRAAQRKLTTQAWNTQGTVYHLTPQNAPIDFIAQLYTTGIPALDQGVVALHRAAASACGERTAQASWAIHYWVGVGISARPEPGNNVYTFFVDTRNGWRFWGSWCDVGKSTRWLRANSWCAYNLYR